MSDSRPESPPSTPPTLDVVGVGNAIVDVIVNVDEGFIVEHGLAKSAMTLIDADRATSLYAAMPAGIETSGGSAANTMAGLASFGARTAYVGKVRSDQLGEVFVHDLRATGVAFDVPPATTGPPTARCLIQVTPDAERTMNTYLGISALLEPADVDTDLVASAQVVYCEGYLWDVDVAKKAIRTAMDAAADAGRTVAMTLSDGFCVERHRDEWLELIHERVDILFANRQEVAALFLTDDFDEAVERCRALCDFTVVTRGPLGSVVVTDGDRIEIDAHPVEHLVDTTGAGDLYAAGFLYGYTNGADLKRCGELASLAAAEVISHMGARPAVPLSTLTSELD